MTKLAMKQIALMAVLCYCLAGQMIQHPHSYREPSSLWGPMAANWRMLDGSGTTVTDSSGNGRDCSFPGGANNPTWTSAGLDFDGTNDYISCPEIAHFNDPVGAYTVQCVAETDPKGDYRMLWNYGASGNAYGYGMEPFGGAIQFSWTAFATFGLSISNNDPFLLLHAYPGGGANKYIINIGAQAGFQQTDDPVGVYGGHQIGHNIWDTSTSTWAWDGDIYTCILYDYEAPSHGFRWQNWRYFVRDMAARGVTLD